MYKIKNVKVLVLLKGITWNLFTSNIYMFRDRVAIYFLIRWLCIFHSIPNSAYYFMTLGFYVKRKVLASAKRSSKKKLKSIYHFQFPFRLWFTALQSGRSRHNSYHKDTLPSTVTNLEAISSSWSASTTSSPANENNINANNEMNNNNNNRGEWKSIRVVL